MPISLSAQSFFREHAARELGVAPLLLQVGLLQPELKFAIEAALRIGCSDVLVNRGAGPLDFLTLGVALAANEYGLFKRAVERCSVPVPVRIPVPHNVISEHQPDRLRTRFGKLNPNPKEVPAPIGRLLRRHDHLMHRGVWRDIDKPSERGDNAVRDSVGDYTLRETAQRCSLLRSRRRIGGHGLMGDLNEIERDDKWCPEHSPPSCGAWDADAY